MEVEKQNNELGGLTPFSYLQSPFEKKGRRYRTDFTQPFIRGFAAWLADAHRPGLHGRPCRSPKSRSCPSKPPCERPPSRTAKAVLVRLGIDATAGAWNAPVRPETNEYIFVPIPEVREKLRPGLVRTYDEIVERLERFGAPLPTHLRGRAMHLDPDFQHLTYGDKNRRGRQLRSLRPGDLLVFYAGLKPLVPSTHTSLIYALVGMFEVDEIIPAQAIPSQHWHENAHTIRYPEEDDLVIRARPGTSGLFRTCIPIGEYRRRSYRVRTDILTQWGDLDVRDGYIQRSAYLPRFLNTARFLKWLNKHSPTIDRRPW